jgi:hypothetical protein
MCRIAGDLVSEALRGDDGNLVADSLVGLEIERELRVVPLNDDLNRVSASIVHSQHTSTPTAHAPIVAMRSRCGQ